LSAAVSELQPREALLGQKAPVLKDNLFQNACAWLPDHDLTSIAKDYGLQNLDRICESDPPLPDGLPP
jgi:hypothetical protein